MRTLPAAILLAALLPLALGACGQKGPLYLPDAAATPAPDATRPADEPDAKKDEDDKKKPARKDDAARTPAR